MPQRTEPAKEKNDPSEIKFWINIHRHQILLRWVPLRSLARLHRLQFPQGLWRHRESTALTLFRDRGADYILFFNGHQNRKEHRKLDL